MATPLNQAALESLPRDVTTPAYDRGALSAGIVHVGVGNFHRAHMAVYLDRLFGQGESHDWAILGAGVRQGDAKMREALQAQDWLTTVVELDPAGLSARVTGSMIDFAEVDPAQTIARMTDPAIRIVSLTVTEKGYCHDPATGDLNPDHPDIKADLAKPHAIL